VLLSLECFLEEYSQNSDVGVPLWINSLVCTSRLVRVYGPHDSACRVRIVAVDAQPADAAELRQTSSDGEIFKPRNRANHYEQAFANFAAG